MSHPASPIYELGIICLTKCFVPSHCTGFLLNADFALCIMYALQIEFFAVVAYIHLYLVAFFHVGFEEKFG